MGRGRDKNCWQGVKDYFFKVVCVIMWLPYPLMRYALGTVEGASGSIRRSCQRLNRTVSTSVLPCVSQHGALLQS
jgi:hypothetical protein